MSEGSEQAEPRSAEPAEGAKDVARPPEPPEDVADDQEVDDGPSVDAPTSRRRFAPAVLVVGLVVALLVGRQAMPTSRTVVLRLDGDRSQVRSVQLAVGRLADAEEAFSSVEWRYEAGSPPPPVLRKELSLASGQHRFRVEVGREGGAQAETTRVVDVADEEVTIRATTH